MWAREMPITKSAKTRTVDESRGRGIIAGKLHTQTLVFSSLYRAAARRVALVQEGWNVVSRLLMPGYRQVDAN